MPLLYELKANCAHVCALGLVYLLNKHLVDRYNIYFAYGPSKIDRNIHASAVNFVMIAVMLLQFMIVFFTILRASKSALFTVSSFFCGGEGVLYIVEMVAVP